jgi:(1->4)-alpha-D-glucan 1-alpha-D-glucosylmutase
MRIPVSTYRLQFNQGFRFVDGRDLAPYLSELGITDMYSSPQYKARRGSSHGYDVANPLRVNSELGAEEDFDEMAEKLRHYDIGLVLDTVPNHMAASYENPWWTDVLENGQASAFAGYFDIDWHPPTAKAAFLQDDRVLLPILGDLYGNVLANNQLALKIEDTGIHVRHFDTRLPLDPKTYGSLLARLPETAETSELLREIDRLPPRDETDQDRLMERRREKERIKERLWRAYHTNPEIKRALDETLLAVAASPDDLDALLGQQAYRMAYWKIGYEEINYRRFFDINELVGLKIDNVEVFDNRNRRTLELVQSGKVTGLRIDHIDGLWDPECYLRRIQSKGGDPYVVVEKILGRDESMPRQWPVAGTTGYDFLNAVNGIFIDGAGLEKIEQTYRRLTGTRLPFAELVYQCNKLVIEELFRGDLNALAHHLGALAARHRQARDVRLSELTEALIEITACLPVYRTYIHDFEVEENDRGYIERTVALARARRAADRIGDAAFDFIQSVLLLEPPPYLDDRKKEWLEFVMRWQQFTGPVMAKGFEDTAAYRHNALLSLNEVGSDPLREKGPFDLEEFHEFLARRREEWPDTMNATATHDTKRGEDARARLNVLSEMPEEWERRLERWMAWNAEWKTVVGGREAPSASEEILVYQTLLGAWPCEIERVHEFLTKALREAKANSSWIAPREEYERAVMDFSSRLVADEGRWLADFREFQAILARHGARNGLGQLVLKIAAPGIPDFYQGAELWQFSMVDPDNRRPVDYKRRSAMLDDLRRRQSDDRIGLIRELAANPELDEMKLFVTHCALEFRRAHPDLFARGDYLPLWAQGSCARHVCAFGRRLGAQWAVVVAPRWTSHAADWGDTEILLPAGAPEEWSDCLTGLTPRSWRIADLLAEFPVAMLKSGQSAMNNAD